MTLESWSSSLYGHRSVLPGSESTGSRQGDWLQQPAALGGHSHREVTEVGFATHAHAPFARMRQHEREPEGKSLSQAVLVRVFGFSFPNASVGLRAKESYGQVDSSVLNVEFAVGWVQPDMGRESMNRLPVRAAERRSLRCKSNRASHGPCGVHQTKEIRA